MVPPVFFNYTFRPYKRRELYIRVWAIFNKIINKIGANRARCFNHRVYKKLIQAQCVYLDCFALLYAELELIRCLNSSYRSGAISCLRYRLHNQPSIITVQLYFSPH